MAFQFIPFWYETIRRRARLALTLLSIHSFLIQRITTKKETVSQALSIHSFLIPVSSASLRCASRRLSIHSFLIQLFRDGVLQIFLFQFIPFWYTQGLRARAPRRVAFNSFLSDTLNNRRYSNSLLTMTFNSFLSDTRPVNPTATHKYIAFNSFLSDTRR